MTSKPCVILLLYQLVLSNFSSGYLSSSITAPSNGLRWVRVNLPQYRKPGETAQLHCDYDLGNDTLYAVKWYKDDEEFYRYVAKERPPGSSHKVEGVLVDVSHSDNRKVILRSVTLRTGGLYRCEVSAEAPSFASAQSEARMDIISLPTEDPTITGVESQYQIGDEIHLNCTSSESYPASVLHWFINEHLVTSNRALIKYANPTKDKEHSENMQELRTTLLGLRFTLNQRHFFDGSMSVKCVASLSPSLWTNDRSSVVQNLPIREQQQELLGEWSTLMLVKSASNSLTKQYLNKTCLIFFFYLLRIMFT